MPPDSYESSMRSYWIPGSYVPTLSEKRNSFLRLLKNKGFKEERRTKVGLYAIGKSTTLESNKSLRRLPRVAIVQQKGATSTALFAAAVPLLPLPGLAMSDDVGPLTVGTVQDLENHDGSRSR